MDYTEYIKALQQLKDDTERQLLRGRTRLESEVLNTSFDFLDDNLTIEQGVITVPGTGNRVLNKFTSYLNNELSNSAVLEDMVTKYIKNVKKSDDLIFKYHVDTNDIDPKRLKLTRVRDMIFGEIASEFENNGLQQYITQPLRDTLYQGINAGYTLTELKRIMRNQVRGYGARSGQVKRYLTNINRKGMDAYIGAVNRMLMKEFGFNAMIMAGSLIVTSSPQCRHGIRVLKGIIRRKDWAKLKRMAVNNGLIEGTTWDNLPFNKLHWGCRHEFTPTYAKDIKKNK